MNNNISSRQLLAKTVFLLVGVGIFINAVAKEGMWMPPQLKSKAADMKQMGLEIPVEKLFNENGTGLNNAVVLFGKGCTGEIISSKGLILTNHHCGYGSVQSLSNAEHDYFASGFWAMNMQEEIPCPGLTVTFVRKMEDVTRKILFNLSDTMTISERDTLIARRIRFVTEQYQQNTKYDIVIKPFYTGNQYWLMMLETFRDVRLVGFPPNGIGFFGGETDNWMWPRHNGDFSIFRVYADKDNKPADYDKVNKPYQPKQFLSISIKGYREGDFTMVYGFPGTTQEYISSYQLNQIVFITDPIRIAVRTQKLGVWEKNMNESRDIFLKYTSKYAGVANGWKKWQGEVNGIALNNVLHIKRQYENEFQEWASKDVSRNYATTILSRIEANTGATDSLIKGDEYIREAVLGIELIQQGYLLDYMLRELRNSKSPNNKNIATAWDAFYKNYDAETDEKVFGKLMLLFFEKGTKWIPPFYQRMYQEHGNSFKKWGKSVYGISMVASEVKMREYLSNVNPDSNIIKADPAWQLYDAIIKTYREKIGDALAEYYVRINNLNRQYLQYRIKEDVDRDYYSDANLTLRIAYGKVQGIDPTGPANYSSQTNLDQIMAKDNPASDEFKVPEKLRQLYTQKDYGRWSVDSTVPVAFVADNHTSGGNSGSPVLNAKGEMIGINFDRVWDGTMSDLYFDPNLCRNISVDIRYVLFITEKFGNAGWLLKEMRLVSK